MKAFFFFSVFRGAMGLKWALGVKEVPLNYPGPLALTLVVTLVPILMLTLTICLSTKSRDGDINENTLITSKAFHTPKGGPHLGALCPPS